MGTYFKAIDRFAAALTGRVIRYRWVVIAAAVALAAEGLERGALAEGWGLRPRGARRRGREGGAGVEGERVVGMRAGAGVQECIQNTATDVCRKG